MWEDLHVFSWRDKTVPFCGELVGKSHCDGTYYQARQESDVTVIEYIVSGKGTVKVDGTTYKAEAGDIYMLPLYTNHIYYSDKTNPWVKYFINIRGNLPSELIRAYNLELKYIFHDSNAGDIFKEIYDTACNSKLSESERQEIFALCFHKILIRLHNISRNEQRSDDAAIIKSIIDNSPNKIYTINELSEKVNRSKDYIIKSFQKQYGTSPHAYIISKKMESAKILLNETELSIAKISSYIGFCNVEHFSTLFKKTCGVSPRDYRKKLWSNFTK